MDLFDPKPELTAKHGKPIELERRKDPFTKVTLLGSDRKFTKHGQSGIEVSELYPHLGRCVDDMAIIRCMYADSFAHGSGLLQMNTGSLRQGYPSLGSWVTYGLGTENRNLPGFVVMLDQRGGPIGGAAQLGQRLHAGRLPGHAVPRQRRPDPQPVAAARPVSRASSGTSSTCSAGSTSSTGSTPEHESELAARIASYELAFRMQAQRAGGGRPVAGDGRDAGALRPRRPADRPTSAASCLMARRLVERGVRFVQVYSGGGHSDENWDAHGDVNNNHELHCGETDQPIAGLLTDLKRRGLLDETLVVWTGEFGRTPTGQNGKGRDHSPRGFTTWLAGGGVKGGTVDRRDRRVRLRRRRGQGPRPRPARHHPAPARASTTRC